MNRSLLTANALLALALYGCGGGDDNGEPPAAGGKGGMGGSSVSGGSGGGGSSGVSGGGTSSGVGGAGGTSGGAGGTSGGAGGTSGGAGGTGGGSAGATGCTRVPSSDATCVDNVPEAPQAYSCADLASGKALDDSRDNKCWNGNFVPGAAFAYCCPP